MKNKIFFYKCECGQHYREESKIDYESICPSCDIENTASQVMDIEHDFSNGELFSILNELAFDLPNDTVGDITRHILNGDLKALYDALDYDYKTYVLENHGYVETLKLDTWRLDAIRKEVETSFTQEEMKKLNYDDFIDAVDVQNAYEEEWNLKQDEKYYKIIWQEYLDKRLKLVA